MTPTALALGAAGTVLLSTGYALGASGLAPEAAHRAACWRRRTERRWAETGPDRKTTWYALQSYYALRLAAEFVTGPRATLAHMRAVRAVAPERQPAELRDAMAAYIRLHFIETADTKTAVVVPVLPGGSFRTDLTTVHDPTHGSVGITMGTHTVWWPGQETPHPDEKAALQAAHARVQAALNTLDIGPTIRSVRIVLN